MAYIPITTGEIATGEPISQPLLEKIKDNFTDLAERMLDAETGVNVSYPPIILSYDGHVGSGITLPWDSVIKTVVAFNITVTGIRLYINSAGTAGTTEVDILYKRGVGSWTSLLDTKPSVAFGAGDDAVSTNAILDPAEVNLEGGDLLRLDIESAQTGGVGFLVKIDFTKA